MRDELEIINKIIKRLTEAYALGSIQYADTSAFREELKDYFKNTKNEIDEVNISSKKCDYIIESINMKNLLKSREIIDESIGILLSMKNKIEN